ncbi:MAG: ClC family H(+)/Cl(-) exchange transporter [Micrococcales bacterium]|nr:ClC family H(+)/Cl(-) exchange transporter [Micrococcales bacterium]
MPALLSRVEAATWRLVGRAVLTGLVAGVLVVGYRLLLNTGLDGANRIYAALRQHPAWLPVWLVGAVLVGLVIAAAVKRAPAATGSGIPQVKGQILYGLKIRALPVLVVRYIGGALASLAGLSLGREGPSVQLGAGTAQGVARLTGSRGLERDHLISAGAAAGLSAAFNALLSGVVFALEEVNRSFSPLVLLTAAAAALTSDVVSSFAFGLHPVLEFVSLPALPLGQYGWLLALGPLAGAVGVATNRALLGLQTLYGRLPARWRPTIALVIALPFGLFLPRVLGGGEDLIKFAEGAGGGLAMILVLLVGKVVFTSTSFGSGTPGGIFMPILATGALTGCAFGLVAEHVGFPAEYLAPMAVCAMAATLAASLQAPITSILLVVEMSGRVEHTLPVAACVLLALLTANLLRGKPIYDVLLRRFLAVGEPALAYDDETVLELPVEMGSTAAGRRLSAIGLPGSARVVRVRRTTGTYAPTGRMVLLPGDYVQLVVEREPGRPVDLAQRDLLRGLFAPGPAGAGAVAGTGLVAEPRAGSAVEPDEGLVAEPDEGLVAGPDEP